MQALNRAINDAALYRNMLDKLVPAAPPPVRDIGAEVDAWNERVDRERFERERVKAERRSAADRLQGSL